MLLTCKQVSRALEHKNYEDLSRWDKIQLRFHIAICVICGKYNTQVMQFQKLTRRFRNLADDDRIPASLSLCEEKRTEIKKAMHAESDQADE